ncbi:hypothetical protein Tco_0445338, partial [Tanacetum coccineum]
MAANDHNALPEGNLPLAVKTGNAIHGFAKANV